MQRSTSQISASSKMKKKARPNKFCHRLFSGCRRTDDITTRGRGMYNQVRRLASIREMELSPQVSPENNRHEDVSQSQSLPDHVRQNSISGETSTLPQSQFDDGPRNRGRDINDGDDTIPTSTLNNRRRVGQLSNNTNQLLIVRSLL